MERAIRVLVVEDDEISTRILKQYLKKMDGVELLPVCTSSREALAVVSQDQVDILLLDVELPDFSGLELLQTLDKTPQTIFVTSSKDYAVEAFNQNAVDFLLKPFDFPRFARAINRAKERVEEADRPVTQEAASFSQDSIFVRHNAKYVKIPINSITLVEAVGDYANLHTDHRRYTIHTTMKTMEQKLPANRFLRVHRSYIVRIDCIEEIEDNTLSLGADKLIPVGKSYRGKLLQTLNLI